MIEYQYYKTWLDKNSSKEKLKSLCKPYENKKLNYYEVSSEVNKVSNNNAKCIEKYSKEVYVQNSLF